MYASINNVYQRLRVLMNKQQLGFVTPAQFDQLAPQAQQEIFNEDINEYAKVLKYKIRGLEKPRHEIKSNLEDNLRTLLVYNKSLSQITANTFSYPNRYAYGISIFENNGLATTISPEEAIYYINNRYPSSTGRSIAILGSNQLEMIPDTITSGVSMSYYKYPMGSRSGTALNVAPSWAYTLNGKDELYDAANSVDFELPKHLEERIVDKIMSLMGISLRDGDAVQYAEMKEQKEAKE